jgi:hypothetical protein
MQQSCTYGSVRGARGNRRPYRDKIREPDGRLPCLAPVGGVLSEVLRFEVLGHQTLDFGPFSFLCKREAVGGLAFEELVLKTGSVIGFDLLLAVVNYRGKSRRVFVFQPIPTSGHICG